LERPAACRECGSRLEVDQESLPSTLATHEDRHDAYRYADWLPAGDVEWLPNGEGWTPLVDAPTLATVDASGKATADGPEAARVLVKNETTNPTWSWKDRMATMVVSHAVADGADRVATSTTGNHGSSIAAYAARAGVDRTLVFVNPSSEPEYKRVLFSRVLPTNC